MGWLCRVFKHARQASYFNWPTHSHMFGVALAWDLMGPLWEPEAFSQEPWLSQLFLTLSDHLCFITEELKYKRGSNRIEHTIPHTCGRQSPAFSMCLVVYYACDVCIINNVLLLPVLSCSLESRTIYLKLLKSWMAWNVRWTGTSKHWRPG